jgi:hypothetical protein
MRLAFVAVALAAFAVLAWRFALTPDERSRLSHPLRARAAWEAQ